MRTWLTGLTMMLLAGCATAPAQHASQGIFNDALFGATNERIRADDVFALDQSMRQYLTDQIGRDVQTKGAKQALFDSLYSEGQLKLDYDTEMTRTASQAFAVRQGNCLSLAILTSALAKELGLTVRYQMVYLDESWSRSDDTLYFDEHVNVTIIGEQKTGSKVRSAGNEMTIDFLSLRDLKNLHFRVIGENTIVAMFMNNRAAETMAGGDLDRAYWWARAAIEADPLYLPAQNSLGVIYLRHRNPDEAERVLRQILAIEPDNFIAMLNLVQTLKALGRDADASRLEGRLAHIKPHPPFYYFDLGIEAMNKRNFATAKGLFKREIQRQANYDKFHYWLALAYYELGEIGNARKHLAIAIKTSTTRTDRENYSRELAKLNAGHFH
jgi:tetratricopeptide (TPR) repeat protein